MKLPCFDRLVWRRFQAVCVACGVVLLVGTLRAEWTESLGTRTLQTRQDRTPEQWEQDAADVADEDRAQFLQAGFDAYVKEMRAFHARSAQRIARVLYAMEPAPWSATCLASSLRRGGQPVQAANLLREQIARTEEVPQRVALFEALSLALDAAGEEQDRLDALGHAYSDGGSDAQQILGAIALQRGDWVKTGRLFGPLIDRARSEQREPEPWALPGWGLALLEASQPTPLEEGEQRAVEEAHSEQD